MSDNPERSSDSDNDDQRSLSDNGDPGSNDLHHNDTDLMAEEGDPEDGSDDGSDSEDLASDPGGFLDLEAADESDRSGDDSDDSDDSDGSSSIIGVNRLPDPIYDGPPFPQFSRLPAELRAMVWERFCPDLKSQGCVFTYQLSSYLEDDSYLEAGALLSDQTKAARAMRAVNHEARHLVEQRFPQILSLGPRRGSVQIPFDPEMDVVELDRTRGARITSQLASSHRSFFHAVQMICIYMDHASPDDAWDFMHDFATFPELTTVYLKQEVMAMDHPYIPKLEWCRTANSTRNYRLNMTLEDDHPINWLLTWPLASMAEAFWEDNNNKMQPEDEEASLRGYILPGVFSIFPPPWKLLPLYLWNLDDAFEAELHERLVSGSLDNDFDRSDVYGSSGSEEDSVDEYDSSGIDDGPLDEDESSDENDDDLAVLQDIDDSSSLIDDSLHEQGPIELSSDDEDHLHDGGGPVTNFSSPEPEPTGPHILDSDSDDDVDVVPAPNSRKRARRVISSDAEDSAAEDEVAPTRKRRRAQVVESDSEDADEDEWDGCSTANGVAPSGSHVADRDGSSDDEQDSEDEGSNTFNTGPSMTLAERLAMHRDENLISDRGSTPGSSPELFQSEDGDASGAESEAGEYFSGLVEEELDMADGYDDDSVTYDEAFGNEDEDGGDGW